MGIEPTQERLHAPAPDLKSGSPTSELGASGRNVLDALPLDKPLVGPFFAGKSGLSELNQVISPVA